MEIVTRKQAASRGMARYYTGVACGRGHIVQRLVSNGCCVACHRITSKLAQIAYRNRLYAAAAATTL